MLYRKSVLKFNKQKYVNCNIQTIFTEKLSFDNKEYICKTCHSKVIKGKVPCQAVYNDMFVGDIPTELSTLEKLEQILIAQRIVFEKIVVMPKGQQRKIQGAICNVPAECDKTCQTLPHAPESSGIILLKLKRKLPLRGHVYYQAVCPEIVLNALNWLKANNELYITLLKTELRILDFQHFHWLAGHRLSAHIPALPNMVNESIKKESWIKNFSRNWRPLKIV